MNITARIITCLVFGLIALGFWWVTGFDFNERGGDAPWCYGTTLMMMILGVTCPFF